jgi:hypothetical protein
MANLDIRADFTSPTQTDCIGNANLTRVPQNKLLLIKYSKFT